MTVTKKLPPLIFMLLLLFCHNVWAQTEKAKILFFSPVVINEFTFDIEKWKENVEEYQNLIQKEYDRVLKKTKEKESTPYFKKLLDIKRRFEQKYHNEKSTKVLARMMLTSSVVGKVDTYQDIKNPTYVMTCSVFIDAGGPEGELYCQLVNIYKRGNPIYFSDNKIVYPRPHSKKQFMEQPVEDIVNQIWRNIMNAVPKTRTLTNKIEADLNDYYHPSNKISYPSQRKTIADELADGVATNLVSLNLHVDSAYATPLREFKLSAEYGHFIGGNNTHYPIKGEQRTVKIVPLDTKKEIFVTVDSKGTKKKKHRHRQLIFKYRTFDCEKTGQEVEAPYGVTEYEANYFKWYKERFTLRLTSKLSKERNKELLTEDVYFKCPKPYFTADITRKTTKKVLDDPGYGYAGGNLLNSPFMTDRITTEKSKQVIYFDFANKKLLSVPLVPFHNVTKDNEYYEFNRDTCSVEYDRKVTTEKLSPHHKLLRYDGHLSTPFNPRTPMRFRFGNKDLQFSVQQLKRGGFSYHDTESRQLLPEMEYFIPSHRISGELGKLNHVMDITKAFAVTFEQMNGEDPCDISALKREMDAFQDGVNNGFFAPQENEFTEYNVNIRRSSKGEIKLFNKQRKKMHARRFTKALEKVAIDEQKWKKYLPKELELIEKEKLNFEETMQLFAFPVLMLENFDQVLAGLSKEFDLEKLNQLKHLNEQQKRQLLEQLKQMTKGEQRDFLEQLNQSSTDNQAKMIEELVKQHQSK